MSDTGGHRDDPKPRRCDAGERGRPGLEKMHCVVAALGEYLSAGHDLQACTESGLVERTLGEDLSESSSVPRRCALLRRVIQLVAAGPLSGSMTFTADCPTATGSLKPSPTAVSSREFRVGSGDTRCRLPWSDRQ